MTELASKNCVPCRGGAPPLAGKELEALASQVPQWKVVDGHAAVIVAERGDGRQGEFVRREGIVARDRRRKKTIADDAMSRDRCGEECNADKCARE